jgi:hypothetical protein
MNSRTQKTSEEKSCAEQIVFARHIFDNYQALIRSLDAKAGALLAVGVFLGASSFPVFKDAVTHLTMKTGIYKVISGALIASGGLFCVVFIILLHCLSVVVRPRGARFYKQKESLNHLIWQEHTAKHGDNVSYYQAVYQANSPVILRNLTDQIFELTQISREKMGAINSAFKVLYWLGMFWVLSVITGFILLGVTK